MYRLSVRVQITKLLKNIYVNCRCVNLSPFTKLAKQKCSNLFLCLNRCIFFRNNQKKNLRRDQLEITRPFWCADERRLNQWARLFVRDPIRARGDILCAVQCVYMVETDVSMCRDAVPFCCSLWISISHTTVIIIMVFFFVRFGFGCFCLLAYILISVRCRCASSNAHMFFPFVENRGHSRWVEWLGCRVLIPFISLFCTTGNGQHTNLNRWCVCVYMCARLSGVWARARCTHVPFDYYYVF